MTNLKVGINRPEYYHSTAFIILWYYNRSRDWIGLLQVYNNKKSVGIFVPWEDGSFPFPYTVFPMPSHSHSQTGNMAIGNPIPMAISTVEGIKQYCDPSVCLSVPCPQGTDGAFYALWLRQNTNGNANPPASATL